MLAAATMHKSRLVLTGAQEDAKSSPDLPRHDKTASNAGGCLNEC
jgi:hypothetical protein